MANALARETSPYLLQHRDNPVDWLPWGPEALGARAGAGPAAAGVDRLLGVPLVPRDGARVLRGPATVAALMNEHFVCVKVDREERPDVDAIYMEAVQVMTGHGGWPLNVFLTPDQVPFYGGTYFPPAPRHGHAGLAGGARGRRRGVGRAPRRDRRPGRADGAAAGPTTALRRPRRRRARARAARRRGAQPARGRSTHATAASAARRSSRRPRRCCCCGRRPRAGGHGRRRPVTWRPRRCARWPPAASTTRSAAASRATRRRDAGPSRTSRRCCTTTRCSRAPTCTAGS